MTFAAISAALCLRSSLAQDGDSPEQMQQEVALQTEQAEAAEEAATDVVEEADAILHEVRLVRYGRLDTHAQREAWSVETPPAVPADSEEMAWWAEWVLLQSEMGPSPEPPTSPVSTENDDG